MSTSEFNLYKWTNLILPTTKQTTAAEKNKQTNTVKHL